MRILFLESDKHLRDFFGSKLKDEFKGVIDIASTGKEAMKLLKKERPYDVIISDNSSLKGSGLDLLRFKNRNKINGAFIFFCSIKQEIPAVYGEFDQLDKLSFGLLCEKIREVK